MPQDYPEEYDEQNHNEITQICTNEAEDKKQFSYVMREQKRS